jgi:transcriptional regulator GlxA family with amidase domain
MKYISILVPRSTILASLEGSRQLFAQVNEFNRQKNEPPAFEVQLVGLDKHTTVSGGLYTINADVTIDEVTKTDLIIVPAIDGEPNQAIEQNAAFIPWIKQHYQQGTEVASLCLGAFLLASTGLLDGKQCATHWIAANQFRQMFPKVELVSDRIITEERGLYSSGGAFSYLNLILHLIEKYAGKEISVLSAKVFAIEMERTSQSAFMIFQGQKEHEDRQIRAAQEFIENNFHGRTTVDQLAEMLALGRRSLERRFKKATSNTVNEYIQRVKIEAAKKDLEASNKNINEIMYDVGYSDTKAFRNTFKKITGLSPIEYRNKYNTVTAVA